MEKGRYVISKISVAQRGWSEALEGDREAERVQVALRRQNRGELLMDSTWQDQGRGEQQGWVPPSFLTQLSESATTGRDEKAWGQVTNSQLCRRLKCCL